MADIFISYASRDRDRIASLVETLQNEGWSVWWDRELIAGPNFDDKIEEALAESRCVAVAWSLNSIGSRWCRDEATEGFERGVLVPLRLDEVRPPLGFRSSQTASLVGWPDECGELESFLAGIRACLSASRTAIRSKHPVDPNSIAVLPLRNIDGSELTSIYCNGLLDDMIDSLTRVPSLRVAARRDVLSIPADTSSAEVRERLRVKLYVEGSVRLVSSRIRIVIQLTDSTTGRQLQSRRFDREIEDFFAIQDEIVKLIVANLRVALPPSTRGATGGDRGTTSIDAYVAYRHGIDELNNPSTTQTIQHALDWFAQSIKIDNEYAAAHAGVCLAYSQGFMILQDTALITKAERASERALSLDPNLDVVQQALGRLYRYEGQYDKAEESYMEALEINPSHAAALVGLADVYSQQQRLTEAENRFREAVEFQPGNWSSYNALGAFLFQHGRYEEAAVAYKEVTLLNRENMVGWGNLGTSLLLHGDFDGAARAFTRSLAIDPQSYVYSNLGLMYYYIGDYPEAISAHEEAIKLAPDNPTSWMNLGDALSASNRAAQADRTFTQAEKLAEDLLAVNPKDPEILIDLAWVKAMLDKPEEASTLAHDAQSLSPDSPYTHYIRGLILTRDGHFNDALQELELAIRLGHPVRFIAAEPHLELLQSEPRFRHMLGI